jgi:hypothetical protein
MLASKSSTSSSSEMAELRIIRNLLRCWTASDSEQGFVLQKLRTGDSKLLLDNSGKMMFLKVIGLVMVLRVCDGDFMVVVRVDKGFSEWLLDTLLGLEKVRSERNVPYLWVMPVQAQTRTIRYGNVRLVHHINKSKSCMEAIWFIKSFTVFVFPKYKYDK